MEWTQLLKELASAVETHNRALAPVRSASAQIADLIGQAVRAGVPGGALARVVAGVEPLVDNGPPPACGCRKPVVPPVRPSPVPAQPTATHSTLSSAGAVDGEEARYSLREAWERRWLPWKPATTRQYFGRSRDRGVRVPTGVRQGQVNCYTEGELRTWLSDWSAKAGRDSSAGPTHA